MFDVMYIFFVQCPAGVKNERMIYKYIYKKGFFF